MQTPRMGLPLILGGQAQKHVTHNEALSVLDALLPSVVVSATVTTPPASPAEGEAYIIPSAGWPTVPGVVKRQIAVYQGGFWIPVPSVFGHRVFVIAEGRERINAGSRGWVPGSVGGRFGTGAGLRVLEYDVNTTSGLSVSTANAIPARVIVLGVTSWVVNAITGPAAWRVGITGETDKFGGALNPANGRNVGVVGPYATYAAAPLIVSVESGTTAFTGGRVRLALSVLEFDDGTAGIGA